MLSFGSQVFYVTGSQENIKAELFQTGGDLLLEISKVSPNHQWNMNDARHFATVRLVGGYFEILSDRLAELRGRLRPWEEIASISDRLGEQIAPWREIGDLEARIRDLRASVADEERKLEALRAATPLAGGKS